MRSLPAVVVLPLHEVPTLAPALDLLLGEIDSVRCGNRMLADRLFEVVLIQLFRWMLDHVDDPGLPNGLLTGLADERLAPAEHRGTARLLEPAGVLSRFHAADRRVSAGLASREPVGTSGPR